MAVTAPSACDRGPWATWDAFVGRLAEARDNLVDLGQKLDEVDLRRTPDLRDTYIAVRDAFDLIVTSLRAGDAAQQGDPAFDGANRGRHFRESPKTIAFDDMQAALDHHSEVRDVVVSGIRTARSRVYDADHLQTALVRRRSNADDAIRAVQWHCETGGGLHPCDFDDIAGDTRAHWSAQGHDLGLPAKERLPIQTPRDLRAEHLWAIAVFAEHSDYGFTADRRIALLDNHGLGVRITREMLVWTYQVQRSGANVPWRDRIQPKSTIDRVLHPRAV